MFVPIGLLLAIEKIKFPILWSACFSLLVEGSQLLFRKGMFETDDIISNTAGAVFGLLLYKLIMNLRQNPWIKEKTQNLLKHKVIQLLLKKGNEVYKKYIKRLLDILISVLVLVILSPIYLLTWIAIKLESPGPAIFRQTRLGKDHKEFTLYKFRSMVVNAEHTGSGVYSGKNDARVTKIGRIIRATSIDELPQAWNMLKGDMSLIGPRPPLTYHPWPISQYTKEQLHMFDVRPGITGWAQVHGRKEVEWHERIKLNNWYVDHCSFLLDVKILFMTVFKVATNADNENTGATVRNE